MDGELSKSIGVKEKEESIWRKQNNWNTEEKKGGEGNGEKCSKKEKSQERQALRVYSIQRDRKGPLTIHIMMADR